MGLTGKLDRVIGGSPRKFFEEACEGKVFVLERGIGHWFIRFE